MSRYKIGSVWIMKLPHQIASKNRIGKKFKLILKGTGCVGLVQENQKVPWIVWLRPNDLNNISQSEWNTITGGSIFEEDTSGMLNLNTPNSTKIKFSSTSTEKLNLETNPCFEREIYCNCDVKDLFWNGHKCGREKLGIIK